MYFYLFQLENLVFHNFYIHLLFIFQKGIIIKIFLIFENIYKKPTIEIKKKNQRSIKKKTAIDIENVRSINNSLKEKEEGYN